MLKVGQGEFLVTPMLVTDVGDQMCWWQVDVNDRFRMLVTDLIHWENHQHNEKSRQHHDSATNIWNHSPSKIQQHNGVANITVTHRAWNSRYLWTVHDGFEFLRNQRSFICQICINFAAKWLIDNFWKGPFLNSVNFSIKMDYFIV